MKMEAAVISGWSLLAGRLTLHTIRNISGMASEVLSTVWPLVTTPQVSLTFNSMVRDHNLGWFLNMLSDLSFSLDRMSFVCSQLASMKTQGDGDIPCDEGLVSIPFEEQGINQRINRWCSSLSLRRNKLGKKSLLAVSSLWAESNLKMCSEKWFFTSLSANWMTFDSMRLKVKGRSTKDESLSISLFKSGSFMWGDQIMWPSGFETLHPYQHGVWPLFIASIPILISHASILPIHAYRLQLLKILQTQDILWLVMLL